MERCKLGAFITNLGKFNEGEIVGEWINFPIKQEEFQKVLDRIGINENYEEYFFSDYDTNISGISDALGEYANADELRLLRRNRGSLAVFGAFTAVLIYGGIMNFAAAVMYNSASLNWTMLLVYYISGFPMDLIHACVTVIVILLVAEPMLEKLDRIKVKYGLVE